MQIFSVADRIDLERNVLRPIITDPDFQKRAVLGAVSRDDFENQEHQKLLTEVQVASLAGRPFDYVGTDLEEVVSDILANGLDLNGQWSVAVERLKTHAFDRLTYSCTDYGNAERFQSQHGRAARYDHTRGRWILWDGTRWNPAAMNEAVELMAGTARSIYVEASCVESEGDRKKLGTWALQSESRKRILDGLALAQALPSIRTTTDRFDADPWLLNLSNGTLDLRGGTFLQHDHRRLCSKMAGPKYVPSADCPWWSAFLNRIFGGDQELVAFYQRAIGYCLTGTTGEQVLFFAYGSGANGKTTGFEIFRMLLGDYLQRAPSELLLLRRGDGIPLDVARLQGSRLVVCSEIEAGRRLNESRVKDLVGGDTLVARFLFGNFFEFTPTHKLWLFGNHKPVVTGTDLGIWRRILLIPFQVTIPESERRPMAELLDRAHAELPGILNWALEGLEEWKRGGLQVPAGVRRATDAYRAASDTVQNFIDEACQPTGEVGTKDLYSAFQTWAGSTSISSRAFLESVKERGYILRAGAYRARYVQGLSLQSGGS
jgi:putative DNA primase/helicase